MDLAGRGPAPGDPLPPRQAPLALPAATPADPLLLDEAEKENAAVPKPKKATAAREPGEKRARRRKSEATADPDDMVSSVCSKLVV